jgi:aminopeptidase YwaD
MKRRLAVLLAFLAPVALAREVPPLLDRDVVHALSQEISGELAKRNLERVVLSHRMRGSEEFGEATRHLADQVRNYGLYGIEILELPADGEIFYGTQRSRPPWNATFAELWETGVDGEDLVRIASWDSMPMRLAQDSESASVTARLIDVGSGTSTADYEGKQVRGSIVLTSSQPGSVADLAVGEYGAAGIVSWAQNQRTAWWGENEDLVRWGHLETFSEFPAFAFMLSPKEARGLQRRLAAGESITLRADVRAGKEPGAYEILTATIPGETDEEIVYSCHLDHPRPGANDNASGCVAILEVARSLSKLIAEGKLPQPRRTIRFVWPPEIEGTMALLTARRDITAKTVAAIHLDMVGGGPETKAVFHVTRGPASLPSFIYDVSQDIGRWVNARTSDLAKTGSSAFPLVENTGGKEPLQAEMADFTIGSDHQIFTEGSFRIPAVYLNDWPDRYIHTTWDTSANIDPTKLKRSIFIAAATGWALANIGPDDVPEIVSIVERGALRRTAGMLERRGELDPREAANLVRFHSWYERELASSIERFVPIGDGERERLDRFLSRIEEISGEAGTRPGDSGTAALVYRRNPEIPGPVSVFGYDYLEAHYGRARTAELQLLKVSGGRRGSGADYAYEALNFVGGERTVGEIRDALSAIYGPIPIEVLAEYFRALESIDLISR